MHSASIPAALPAPAPPTDPATRSVWALLRVLGGLTVLALLLWRLGTGPFLDGLRVVDGGALAVAFGIGVLTTGSCAWRWRLIAGGLGVRLPLGTAVAAYYRSQFLNTTLPGGVVGDVHRAVRHGRDIGDVRKAVRAVVWDRFAGLAVQVAVGVVVLLVLPSPVRSSMPVVTAIAVVGGLCLVTLARALGRGRSSRWVRALRTIRSDVRTGLFARGTWLAVVLASIVMAAGNLATFLLAARTAGATAPLTVLVPLTLLALLAMGLPLNIAGWGPREGVAAWVFAAAGLTAAQGVATAVVYGVLVLVASLPGAAVLVVRWLSRRPTVRPQEALLPRPRVPAAQPEGAVRG